MDYDVETIHAYPTGILSAFHMQRNLSGFLFQSLVNVFGNGPDLRTGVSFADDEEVSRRVIQLPKIQFDDVLSLDILYAVYD
jgi:hypothetical protein